MFSQYNLALLFVVIYFFYIVICQLKIKISVSLQFTCGRRACCHKVAMSVEKMFCKKIIAIKTDRVKRTVLYLAVLHIVFFPDHILKYGQECFLEIESRASYIELFFET